MLSPLTGPAVPNKILVCASDFMAACFCPCSPPLLRGHSRRIGRKILAVAGPRRRSRSALVTRPRGVTRRRRSRTIRATPTATVTWTIQGVFCADGPGGSSCHYEYCLTETYALGPEGHLSSCNGLWSNAPSPFTLTSGSNSIYAEFRTASNGSYGYSNPQLTPLDITLNATAPAVTLNSAAGILDPVSSPSLQLANQ